MPSNQFISLLPIPVIIIVVGLFAQYIHSQASKSSVNQRVFTCIRSLKAFSIFFGILSILSCIAYFSEWNNPTRSGLLWLALAIGVIAIPLMIMAFNMKVIINEDNFVVYPALGKKKKISFSDIEAINYSDIKEEYVVTLKNGKKTGLELNQLQGYHDFLKILEEKTHLTILLTPNLKRRGY